MGNKGQQACGIIGSSMWNNNMNIWKNKTNMWQGKMNIWYLLRACIQLVMMMINYASVEHLEQRWRWS